MGLAWGIRIVVGDVDAVSRSFWMLACQDTRNDAVFRDENQLGARDFDLSKVPRFQRFQVSEYGKFRFSHRDNL